MKTFFRRLFRSSDRRPTTVQNRSRFRPFVESLEAREVPALFTWVGSGFGAGADFDTQTNWTYNGGGTATRLPAAGDDLAFISSMSGNVNNAHGPASGAYNSVSLNGAYRSTITLIGGFTTTSLTLDAAGAAISQPSASGGYSNTDITVTSSFNWTNGTLNSSAHLSNLILDGATALIAPRAIMDLWNPMNPPIPGTLTTGDNITFVNAAIGTVKDGEIDFGNGAGIDLKLNALLVIAPQNTGTRFDRVNHMGVDGRLLIESGATLEVYRPDPNKPADDWISTLPVDNDGGKFWIHGKITADISGEVFSTGSSVHQTGATSLLLLENGSTLKVQNDFTLGGGKLSTAPVGSTYLQSEATIRGNMKMTEASSSSMTRPTTRTWELTSSGNSASRGTLPGPVASTAPMFAWN